MRRERVVADVSRLPTVVFGSRNLVSWGTLGFMVIEGFSLALCAVTYVYLRKNSDVWPPHGTQLPQLLVPTINMAVMILSLPLAIWTKRRAERMDTGATRIGGSVSGSSFGRSAGSHTRIQAGPAGTPFSSQRKSP